MNESIIFIINEGLQWICILLLAKTLDDFISKINDKKIL